MEIERMVPCNVCGTKDFNVHYEDELKGESPSVDYRFTPQTRKTFQIVQCASCDLIFTNPMPKMEMYYQATEDDVYEQYAPQQVLTAKKVLNRIRKEKSSGKLLDVGCATGVFLNEASQYFQVEGIELSKWSAERASKKFTIHSKPLSAFDWKEKYDVITLFGVIEHFEDPRIEMEAAFRALRPGGLLVLYTGDVDAFLPKLLGKSWWWYQGMHLFYFSKRTLSRLLKTIGFEEPATQNYTVYFSLPALANSLNRYKFFKWLRPVFEWKGLQSLFIPLTLSGEMLLLSRKPR